jgi:hypothetical protein
MGDIALTSPDVAQPEGSDSSKPADVLFTIPYQWDRGNRDKNTKILDFLCAHPYWVTVPLDEVGRRIHFTWILTDPKNRIREVWNGGELVGMLYLGDIVPYVSATVHWIFLDQKLAGKRRLLWAWMGECFREFDLQRLTFYAPDFLPVIEEYARRRFGFRYEGEVLVESDETIARSRHLHGKEKFTPITSPSRIARFGSRRERSHWHNGEWRDIIVLRLLRSEYDAREAPA